MVGHIIKFPSWSERFQLSIFICKLRCPEFNLSIKNEIFKSLVPEKQQSNETFYLPQSCWDCYQEVIQAGTPLRLIVLHLFYDRN